jgi:PhzF family phenazine biosynthesis protein
MRSIDVTLLDAFSNRLFGGNVAGVVVDAEGLSDDDMRLVAREIAAPVTGFAWTRGPGAFEARFFTPGQEIGACGHVTVGLFSLLSQDGRLAGEGDAIEASLKTKAGQARIEVRRLDGEADLVMLQQNQPAFRPCALGRPEVAGALGISGEDIEPGLPLEMASTGLSHLFVPVRDLATVAALRPDMRGLADLSGELGVDTVDVFALETVEPGRDVHSRDFCPAVGVPEAPASGTTNGALTCYLVRNGVARAEPNGAVTVLAEQGYEMGRPSLIRSEARVQDWEILEIAVGGTAVRSLEGRIALPGV